MTYQADATTFRSWDDLSELEQLQQLYSDAHKDAFGFRPRSGCDVLSPITLEDYREAMDYCSQIINEEEERERKLGLQRQREYEREIDALLATGASDRATAVRWWFEANGFNEPEPEYSGFRGQEAEGVLYDRGFPMGLWPIILPEFMGEEMPAWGY